MCILAFCDINMLYCLIWIVVCHIDFSCTSSITDVFPLYFVVITFYATYESTVICHNISRLSVLQNTTASILPMVLPIAGQIMKPGIKNHVSVGKLQRSHTAWKLARNWNMPILATSVGTLIMTQKDLGVTQKVSNGTTVLSPTVVSSHTWLFITLWGLLFNATTLCLFWSI